MPRIIMGYEVIDFIGEGAGSMIYAAVDPATSQIYALKHVVRRTEKCDRFFTQLNTEFDVSSRLTHAGLRRSIRLVDNRKILRRATEAALIMELFDGTPLETMGPQPPMPAIEIFIRVAEALAALHLSGFIHCDLKPNNILVSASGTVKVIDFGQACRAGTIKERIQGTPDYIAPEQVKRDPMTARTDVFNFGATLYWGLIGRPIPTLFKIKKSDNSFLVDERIATPRDLNPSVPEGLSNLAMECVRTHPARRPPDMADVHRRLELIRHSIRHRAASTA